MLWLTDINEYNNGKSKYGEGLKVWKSFKNLYRPPPHLCTTSTHTLKDLYFVALSNTAGKNSHFYLSNVIRCWLTLRIFWLYSRYDCDQQEAQTTSNSKRARFFHFNVSVSNTDTFYCMLPSIMWFMFIFKYIFLPFEIKSTPINTNTFNYLLWLNVF